LIQIRTHPIFAAGRLVNESGIFSRFPMCHYLELSKISTLWFLKRKGALVVLSDSKLWHGKTTAVHNAFI
jgi:hypothetical protein